LENIYGTLRGRLLGRLIALFKRAVYMLHEMVYARVEVSFIRVAEGRRLFDLHPLVTVQLRDITRMCTILDSGIILGVTHLIPETDRCWLVNSWLNLYTFNNIH